MLRGELLRFGLRMRWFEEGSERIFVSFVS